MKRVHCYFAAFAAIFILRANAEIRDLPSGVSAYESRVAAIDVGTNEKVKTYIHDCLSAVALLNGISETTPGVSDALARFSQTHDRASDVLDNSSARKEPSIREETRAYNECLQPFMFQNYLGWVRLQKELIDRKYFKSEPSKNSNFLEAYINSELPLTADHPNELRTATGPRPLGVSPWEAIMRFEPTAAMRGGPQAAIIGSAGLTYTCFPDVEQDKLQLEDNFASKYVKKAGICAGLGAARFSGKTRLLTGPGVQINAVALWALYQPNTRAWMLGVSMADLSKLNKILGWFK